MSQPTPFDPSFSRSDVDRMLAKVRDARLPPAPILPGASWEYGVELGWLEGLQKEWATAWSYEAFEQQLRSFSHFRADVEGLSIHFIHAKSSRPDAIPLLLVHGWPSSFLEFTEVIAELANPPEGTVAFNVVVPSLPGFGFSDPPPRANYSSKDVARLFNTLMVESLGYQTYATSAGDWGTSVTIQALDQFPAHAKCANFNMLFAKPPAFSPASALALLSFVPLPRAVIDWVQALGLDAFERRGLALLRRFWKEGAGYQAEQGTKPMTIGSALFDNPVGILAWIGEKFHDWSDPRAPDAPSRVTKTHILNQIALYHLTSTIHTSCLPYKDYRGVGAKSGEEAYLWSLPKTIPVGLSVFPHEIAILPKAWYESSYNLVQYRRHEFGGHFAAVDNHEAYIKDVRDMMANNFPRA